MTQAFKTQSSANASGCANREAGFSSRSWKLLPFSGTLDGELGLSLHGAVSVVRHAGVDAGVLLRQVGDLEAASPQELHTALAGKRDRERVSVWSQGGGRGWRWRRQPLVDPTSPRFTSRVTFYQPAASIKDDKSQISCSQTESQVRIFPLKIIEFKVNLVKLLKRQKSFGMISVRHV